MQRFAPPLDGEQRRFASLQYLGLMAASTAYLWHADAMRWQDATVYCLALCAAAWATGGYLQGRLRALEVLAVQAACVVTFVGLGLWP